MSRFNLNQDFICGNMDLKQMGENKSNSESVQKCYIDPLIPKSTYLEKKN